MKFEWDRDGLLAVSSDGCNCCGGETFYLTPLEFEKILQQRPCEYFSTDGCCAPLNVTTNKCDKCCHVT
jgi:hypothetical protein